MTQTDRVPLSDVITKIVVTPEENLEAQEEPKQVDQPRYFMDDPNYHRIAEFMGISYEDRKDSRMADRLSYLYEYAKTFTKSSDRIRNFLHLKGIIKNNGWQEIGKTLVKRLYQWARLDSKRQRIEQEMELLENG